MNSLPRQVIERRQYPRMNKGRKQWNCANCSRLIAPGEDHEHSFAHRDDRNKGYPADIRLCVTCSTEV